MFRSFASPLLAKVPYASLFEHNYVLSRVFQAPPGKVALTEEFPGHPTARFTYGELQRDVVALADTMVLRKEAVAQARGEAPLGWLQTSKPAHVRSVFAQGERTASCDYMQDTGFYTTSVLGGPGYVYVVSLLASWTLNQLTTPMSVSQKYDDELMYVLEHSGSRSIVGETALLKEKFPAPYEELYVRAAADVGNIPLKVRTQRQGQTMEEVSSNTFLADTVYDATQLVRELRGAREKAGATVLAVEEMGTEDGKVRPINTAADVVRRIDDERAAAAERELNRQASILEKEHKARNSAPAEQGSQQENFSFDTEHLNELNPVFQRWFAKPETRPTKYDDCLMIYTSGTTARPKGCVHTHASVSNMVRVLEDAWEWRDTDSILHVLPLHHIHGLINVLLCSLASHAQCNFTKFDDAGRIAHRLEQGDISLFMAVPTIYTKLIGSVSRKFSPIEKTGFRKGCMEHVRLMVCGSAALPVPTLNQFRELSGHTLLERYGMTEIGIALSQPLRPIADRMPGTVGSPLPTVEVYVHQPETEEAAEQAAAKESQYNEVGSLGVASESLFDRYWNNPAATKKELRTNPAGTRFFDTGDTVGVQHPAGKPPVYAILGRSSVDILKTRGYKLSALEIEAALLSRKDLFYEMAVVGVPDVELGDRVVAVVALQPEAAAARGISFESAASHESPELTAELKKVALEKLAPYKCPSRYIAVAAIPRNAMGKVNKKSLIKTLKL